MSRGILLFHEFDEQLKDNKRALEEANFSLAHVDHKDLFWPKFIEGARWQAVVIHESVLPHIMVELASEVGLSMIASEQPIIIITKVEPESLPSSFESAIWCSDMNLAIRELQTLQIN